MDITLAIVLISFSLMLGFVIGGCITAPLTSDEMRKILGIPKNIRSSLRGLFRLTKPNSGSKFRIVRVDGFGEDMSPSTKWRVEFTNGSKRWNGIGIFPDRKSAEKMVNGYIRSGEEVVYEYDPNMKRLNPGTPVMDESNSLNPGTPGMDKNNRKRNGRDVSEPIWYDHLKLEKRYEREL